MQFIANALTLALSLLTATETKTYTLEGHARAGDKPVADAAIWIEARGAARPAARKHAVIEQKNLRFSQRVLVIEAGTDVDFPNRDRVFHNVFSFKSGKKFDLGLYPTGASKSIHFDEPGVSRLFCNIHPNMASYVVAVDSAYFATTDDAGRFAIANLPPGTFTFHAWRPGGEVLDGTVTVETGAPLEVIWK